MSGVTIEQQIRWGDQDPMGHVNNTVFFQYCESARMAYFEALGLDELRDRPTVGPGLVHAALNFRRQLRYPGAVRITARVTKVSTRSFTFWLTIADPCGEIAADGESVSVWVDYALNKALPLPEPLLAAIRRVEGNDG